MPRQSPIGRSNLKWLIPGIGVKRWLALLAVGIALLGLGAVYVILMLRRGGLLPAGAYRALTLQFLPPWARVAVTVFVGAAAVGLAVTRLSRSTLVPFLQTGGVSLADAVYRQRLRERGPSIVAIGGGTGLSTLLRGLKRQSCQITAIITVSDDGGSSGRLRRELGLPPPGDFRNCIAALADDESLVTQLLQYRFGQSVTGKAEGNGELSGHSFGNLFIAAMAGITGSFESGLEQSSQVLAIQGRILPSTLADVTLVADVREQPQNSGSGASGGSGIRVRRIAGESSITHAGGAIEHIHLEPEGVPGYPAAVRAILGADLVVLGPGSLYTSVLPNLLVNGIQQALKRTRAPIIYVCNVATQPGETAGFTVGDHLQALERHIGHGIVDVVLANDAFPPLDEGSRTQYVRVGPSEGIPLVKRDLVDQQRPWRHDSDRLAAAILSLR